MKSREIVLTAFLSVFILISGYLKIPSPIGGAEFQMSAPIAVSIAMLFGFRMYILSGMVASVLAMSMGLTTFYGLLIQFVFRFSVGLMIWIFGTRKGSILIAGPIGSIAARFVVHLITGVPILVLLLPILPGLLVTPILSYLIYTQGYWLMKRTVFGNYVLPAWTKGFL